MFSVKKKKVECVIVVSFVRGVGSISVVQGDATGRLPKVLTYSMEQSPS